MLRTGSSRPELPALPLAQIPRLRVGPVAQESLGLAVSQLRWIGLLLLTRSLEHLWGKLLRFSSTWARPLKSFGRVIASCVLPGGLRSWRRLVSNGVLAPLLLLRSWIKEGPLWLVLRVLRCVLPRELLLVLLGRIKLLALLSKHLLLLGQGLSLGEILLHLLQFNSLPPWRYSQLLLQSHLILLVLLL